MRSLWSIGEEDVVPARAGPAPRIVRVLEVEDTREYEEGPDGRFHPIPGSGNIRQCSRCGRDHEIHATVQLSDGTTEIIGVGCARRENMDLDAAFRTGEARAKRVRLLTFKLAAERKVLAELTRVAEVLRAETNKIGRTLPEPVLEEQAGRIAHYDPLYRAWVVTARFTATVGEQKAWNLIAVWHVSDPRQGLIEADVLAGGPPMMDAWNAWERDQFRRRVVGLQRAWLDRRVAERAKALGAPVEGSRSLEDATRDAAAAVTETEALLQKALRAKRV